MIMTSPSFYKQNNDKENEHNLNVKMSFQKKKQKVNHNRSNNSSKWTLEQNARFLEFIRSQKQMLACPLKRKEQKVFLRMSQFIVTRTPDQCRSHHQKMIKIHKDLDGIVQNLEKRISKFQNRLPSLEIEKEISATNQIIQKNKKAPSSTFFDPKIDIQKEFDQNTERSLWSILSQEIWIQRPFHIFYNI